MGQRKWAWQALYEARRDTLVAEEGKKDYDALWRAEQNVELATIEEFINDVYEAAGELTSMTENCGQHGVMLGIELTLREMRKLVDARQT